MLAVSLAVGGAAAEQSPVAQKVMPEAPKAGQTASETEAGTVVHQELVQGVMVVFRMSALKERKQGELPPAMRLTHRLMLDLTDPRSGRAVARGRVMARVVAPDKSIQTRGMMLMGGHYFADLALGSKGKYAVTVEFVLRDKKLRTSRFWYEVK
jgi:hypothetical protein